MKTVFPLALLIVLASACGHDAGTAPVPGATPSPSAAPALALAPSDAWKEEELVIPPEKFSDGERAFRTIKDTLLASYYTTGITEDDLYRAAADGMLRRIDPKMQKWNKLLSPGELAEMEADMKGEIVGVGVKIHFDAASGYSDVLGTLPGSPAERAQLQAGDKILSVDGKLYKGKGMREVVRDIRGKAGDKVTLSVLRGDKILTVPLVREVVPFDLASASMIAPNVGYVRIRGFAEKTSATLKQALPKIAGAHAMLIDLRGNSGGLFDDAVTCAGFFLKNGTPILKLEKRAGAMETVTTTGEPLVGEMPLAVLVDGNTSSGAEFVAAALAEGRGAQLVGTRTFGKWSVQKLDKLGNGYAMKFTTSLFHAPSGKTYNGVGLAPDVEVTMDEKAQAVAEGIVDVEKRVAEDPQLRTALGIVRARP
jgi:carboxyl-terminal processing protease